MVCKNCAFMQKTKPFLSPLICALLLSLAASGVQAEKADRLKPLIFTADKGGRGDMANQRTELIGDVVLSKGTMILRAEKVDVRETSDGYYQAYASGQTGKQVSFRQARDVPGEAIEGFADQLEYDTRADTVRFLGNAVVRRTRGSLVTDEVTGAVILFDNRAEVFTLEGGQSSPNPTGRVRIVKMPTAASAPEAPASGTVLQPSTTLQPRKPS